MIKRKNKNKMQFSKKMVICDYIIAIFLIFAMVYFIYKDKSIDYSLTAVTSLTLGNVILSTKYYYQKSMNENRVKMLNGLDEDIKRNVTISGNINME